jgi:hypothetical protein
MDTVSAARRVALAATMIVSPLLIIMGHLLTVPGDEATDAYVADITAAGGRYVPSTVMIAFGVLLLPLACIGLMRFAPRRGGTLVTIGTVLTTIAAVGLGAGNAMFGMVLGSLLPAHPDLAKSVIDAAGNAPAANWGWQLAPLLPAGLVLIAIGLILARELPLWMPIVLGIGALLFFVSGAGGLFTFLLLLPMAVGLAAPGVVLFSRVPARTTADAPRTAVEA